MPTSPHPKPSLNARGGDEERERVGWVDAAAGSQAAGTHN